MRALSVAELDLVVGGNDPSGEGPAAGTIPNPFPDGQYGPPNTTYPGDFRTDPVPSYDPRWNDSGWGADYGNITISPGNGPMPGIGGDGVIVKFPDGTKVGVSTNEDGEPNGVKVTKPI